jgi:hypothetical protein
VEHMLVSPDYPLVHFSEVQLDAPAARDFAHGTRVCAGDSPAWPVRVYGPGRSFLGLGQVLSKGMLRPRVVLAVGKGAGTCG